MPKFIILLGLRASGKTTLGHALAARLGRPFIDLDDVTARVLGVATSGDALRTLGEPAFRRGECEALTMTLNTTVRPNPVLSLGGGTPTYPASHELLVSQRDTGSRLVYLHAPPETLIKRLQQTDLARRPALTSGSDPLTEVSTLYARRDPIYRELATDVVEVGGASEPEVLTSLLAVIGQG